MEHRAESYRDKTQALDIDMTKVRWERQMMGKAKRTAEKQEVDKAISDSRAKLWQSRQMELRMQTLMAELEGKGS